MEEAKNVDQLLIDNAKLREELRNLLDKMANLSRQARQGVFMRESQQLC